MTTTQLKELNCHVLQLIQFITKQRCGRLESSRSEVSYYYTSTSRSKVKEFNLRLVTSNSSHCTTVPISMAIGKVYDLVRRDKDSQKCICTGTLAMYCNGGNR
jgi:hypothetical protein